MNFRDLKDTYKYLPFCLLIAYDTFEINSYTLTYKQKAIKSYKITMVDTQLYTLRYTNTTHNDTEIHTMPHTMTQTHTYTHLHAMTDIHNDTKTIHTQ